MKRDRKTEGRCANAQRPLFVTRFGLVTAAATAATIVIAAGKENNGKDDQPNPVIVKKIAQAVVHNSFLLTKFGSECRNPAAPPSVIILCRRTEKVYTFCRTKADQCTDFSNGQTSLTNTGCRRKAWSMGPFTSNSGSKRGPQELEPMPLSAQSMLTTVSFMGTSS